MSGLLMPFRECVYLELRVNINISWDPNHEMKDWLCLICVIFFLLYHSHKLFYLFDLKMFRRIVFNVGQGKDEMKNNFMEFLFIYGTQMASL